MIDREDIIHMAREAGWRVDSEGEILEGDGWHIQTDIVERFAELVRAEEREACAKVADDGRFLHDDSPEAKFGKACATAIRARGQG